MNDYMARTTNRLEDVIDLTKDDRVARLPSIAEHDLDDEVAYLGEAPVRTNNPAHSGEHGLDSIVHNGFTITLGMSVEFEDGDFLTVEGISQEAETGEVLLTGRLFRRTKKMDGKLAWRLNEVCWLQKTQRERECRTTRLCQEVIATREIIVTNQKYPAYTCVERLGDTAWRKENGQLVCRWINTEEWNEAGTKLISETMHVPTERESDKKKSSSVVLQLRAWTGQHATTKERLPKQTPRSSGTKRSHSDSHTLVDLTQDSDDGFAESATKFYRPKAGARARHTIDLTCTYVYGDIGAGGGGTASGAFKAGLEIKLLLDHDKNACQTLRFNFSDGEVLEQSIFDFCRSQNINEWRVDILHISYPCQPHSPAHTVPGRDDDKNVAASFSVLALLTIIRPRVVTFEQTSGIVTHNQGVFYKALLNQITSIGYSYRSKICNLAEYGVVQPRKRLIIIAACPGETIPPFPETTHGPGLRPFTTIRERLQQRLQQVQYTEEKMHQAVQKPDGQGYDDNQPLARCITTSGGNSLHPDGTRYFNCQELATFQEFPAHHKFAGTVTEVKRQIGNAVPCGFAEQLFRTVVKSMQETDRKVAKYKEPVIELD